LLLNIGLRRLNAIALIDLKDSDRLLNAPCLHCQNPKFFFGNKNGIIPFRIRKLTNYLCIA